jgi:hypothetical protein
MTDLYAPRDEDHQNVRQVDLLVEKMADSGRDAVRMVAIR